MILILILQIIGTVDYTDSDGINAIVNRVYTAPSVKNEINIYSGVGNEDWMECNWTTTQPTNTTDFKREIALFKENP
jgi:hypothetical protein